jgi:penicillin amidase
MTLPQYNTTLHVGEGRAYITNDVLIYRDEFAIPHIKAGTFIESIYGLGYVHALDRLWQMHFRR